MSPPDEPGSGSVPHRGRHRPGSEEGEQLNERQQIYLDVLYAIDQDNEQAQQRRWYVQRERLPAEQWRWITYSVDHPAAEATTAQQQLGLRKVLDTGAGATLAALERRALIEVRHTFRESSAGPTWHTEVKLTRAGRAASRAQHTQHAPEAEASRRGLPAWLHAALQVVADAPEATLAKTSIGRVAARRLGPHGHGYIEDASAWQYRLTPAGRAYLDANGPEGPMSSRRGGQ